MRSTCVFFFLWSKANREEGWACRTAEWQHCWPDMLDEPCIDFQTCINIACTSQALWTHTSSVLLFEYKVLRREPVGMLKWVRQQQQIHSLLVVNGKVRSNASKTFQYITAGVDGPFVTVILCAMKVVWMSKGQWTPKDSMLEFQTFS